MADCLIKVQSIKTPWMGRDTETFKYVATVPNMAGKPDRDGDPTPSFAKPYMIVESSHIPNDHRAPHFFKHFKEQLAFRGYHDLEIV